MAAVASNDTAPAITRLAQVLNPTVEVKLALMTALSKELRSRYGTQQVAADAMEMHQSHLSDLYNQHHNQFSITYLIQIATKLGKKVEVRVV